MPVRDADVERFIRGWLDAKQAADGERIAAGLSAYEGALLIGTEASEWWSGYAAFREAHTAGGPFTATVEGVEAHREGSVAWGAARAVVQFGDGEELTVRLSLVLLEETPGDWRVLQSHASVPDDS
jgi:ketosteroid isomerase-like protein